MEIRYFSVGVPPNRPHVIIRAPVKQLDDTRARYLAGNWGAVEDAPDALRRAIFVGPNSVSFVPKTV